MIRRWLERVLLHLIQHEPEPVVDMTPHHGTLSPEEAAFLMAKIKRLSREIEARTQHTTSRKVEPSHVDQPGFTPWPGLNRIWTTPMGSYSYDEVIRSVAGAETYEGDL